MCNVKEKKNKITKSIENEHYLVRRFIFNRKKYNVKIRN